MFSVYSLRLYFRLLYTSWQHVDRRHPYICLISFGSTRSEEEEEEKAKYSFTHLYKALVYIPIVFSLSLSLILYSPLSFTTCSLISFLLL